MHNPSLGQVLNALFIADAEVVQAFGERVTLSQVALARAHRTDAHCKRNRGDSLRRFGCESVFSKEGHHASIFSRNGSAAQRATARPRPRAVPSTRSDRHLLRSLPVKGPRM